MTFSQSCGNRNTQVCDIFRQTKLAKGVPDTEVEAFVKKYSLGVSGFVSALVAAIIDGEINNSSMCCFHSFSPFFK
jgi:hypothetical protein